MNKTAYDIGDWVKVNATITSYHEQEGRDQQYYRTSNKKLQRQELDPDHYGNYRTVYGRVVGMVRRYEGKVTGFGGEGDFQPSSSMLLIQVKPTWTGKIVEALPEDIESTEPREFPFQGAWQWTDDNRKDQAEEAEDWPRDEKGRWTKR